MSVPRRPERLVPVAETREAFDWLGSSGDDSLEASLMRMSRRVRTIAPECVAMSLSVVDGDLTFTVEHDRPGAALLDAVQYLDGGPCLQAMDDNEIRATANLSLDEGIWQLFARAQSITGISSTLSLPILGDSRQVIGGVNLYGATPDAFVGHHDALATACGAWAAGAVTNADMGFASRVRAAATPGRLLDSADVDLAIGLVAEVSDLSLDEAGSRIRTAAAQAGVSESEFARFLLQAHASDVEGATARDDAGH
jgi:hypothetical protein